MEAGQLQVTDKGAHFPQDDEAAPRHHRLHQFHYKSLEMGQILHIRPGRKVRVEFVQNRLELLAQKPGADQPAFEGGAQHENIVRHRQPLHQTAVALDHPDPVVARGRRPPGIDQFLPVVDVPALQRQVLPQQVNEHRHAVATVEGDQPHDLPGENIQIKIPQGRTPLLPAGYMGHAQRFFPHCSASGFFTSQSFRIQGSVISTVVPRPTME